MLHPCWVRHETLKLAAVMRREAPSIRLTALPRAVSLDVLLFLVAPARAHDPVRILTLCGSFWAADPYYGCRCLVGALPVPGAQKWEMHQSSEQQLLHSGWKARIIAGSTSAAIPLFGWERGAVDKRSRLRNAAVVFRMGMANKRSASRKIAFGAPAGSCRQAGDK